MGNTQRERSAVSSHIERLLGQAERQGVPLTVPSGSKRRALRHRCTNGYLVEPYPGLFARTEYWQTLRPQQKTLHAMRGLQQLHPSWAFCHQSAAVAYGLPVASWHLHDIHRALPYHTARRRQPRIAHHHLGEPDIVEIMGVRATTLAQTVIDCACTLPFCDALAIADAALRLYDLDPARLIDHACTSRSGKQGIMQARTVISLADGASESWGESYARGMMHALGFVRPELQVEINLPRQLGGVRRVDFLWRLPDGKLVIGEFDGKEKYMASDGVDLEAFYRERQRESRLSLTDARILRFGFDDLKDPEWFGRLLTTYGVPRCTRE